MKALEQYILMELFVIIIEGISDREIGSESVSYWPKRTTANEFIFAVIAFCLFVITLNTTKARAMRIISEYSLNSWRRACPGVSDINW